MSKVVQRRRGTTAEHTTFTGALGELTVDITKDTIVVHDGAAAGGYPLLREDGSNSALAIGSAGTPSLKFTGDPNTGLYSPGADQVAISTGGTERLRINPSGNVGIGSTAPVAPLQIGTGNTSANTAKAVFNTGDTTAAALELSNWTGSATTNGPRIFFDNSARGRFSIGGGNGVHSFVIRDNEAASDRLTVDSSGRLLVGTSTARSNYTASYTPILQVETVNTITQRSVGFTHNSNDNAGAILWLASTRGTTSGSNTIVQNNDEIGAVLFNGADGTNILLGAAIVAQVDGTPGANDMPGRLVFSVTADGASSPTEAMRIKNSRILNFANTPTYADNTAAKAGGLVNGDVYRKSDGTLMIVYT